MSATLFLIPTPIDEHNSITVDAKTLIESKLGKAIVCVEEIKEGRRRWLRFGLPRESIEEFKLYNEHTRDSLKHELVQSLKQNKDVILMSDCGLPAFCDPGAELVSLCHDNNIKVTSTAYSNSISLAIALSGIDHNQFIFEGFIPIKNPDRSNKLKQILSSKRTSILMDTPYRLKSLLEQMNEIDSTANICLCLDLNKPQEELIRGTVKFVNSKVEKCKREFIIVVGKSL